MEQTIFVGTYTRGERDEGIFVYGFDPDSGKFEHRHSITAVQDPSFVALSPDHRYLLAVCETDAFEGQSGGGVCSYAVDSQTGGLTALNGQSVRGQHPCYVSFDQTGRYAFAANYGGGSLGMLPVNPDGTLGALTTFIQHQGHSIMKERQNAPHVHCVQVGPRNDRLYVADLGLDQIISYPLDLAEGRLDANAPDITPAEPGAGPRHLAFHPNGRFLYVSNELNSTVAAYRVDPQSGALAPLQTLSTLPEGYSARNDVADIHCSHDGRYLYVSNRGHDSLVGYAVDAETGLLTRIGFTDVRGHWPRNFGFDASGQYVFVANERSDNIVVFRFDADTGALTPTGEEIKRAAPVCVIAAVL